MDSDKPTPRDATEATQEQKDIQDDMVHRNDDPDAPGRHQDRHELAEET